MAIVTPIVFADAVNASLDVALRVGKLATDYTDMVEDITMCGSEVSFPVIDRIEDAGVVTKGTALTPDELSMTDNKATIKHVGKAVRVYDKDVAQVKGELINNMAMQLGETMAKAVDADLVNAIVTEAVYKDQQAELTAPVIYDAFEVFGDAIDNDSFQGILIHSSLRKSLMMMDDFTSVERTNVAIGNGIVIDGCIGLWNGTIPIFVSNNGTKAEDGKALFAIIKKGALGVVWQKQATIEEEREAKLFATDIVANELYATKLVHADGVSVVQIGA